MGDCVVVLLDPDPAAVVARLWADLEKRWGAGRSHAGEPHLTLAIPRGQPDPQRVRSALASITPRCAPFAVLAPVSACSSDTAWADPSSTWRSPAPRP